MSLTVLIPDSLERVLQTSGNFKVILGHFFCFVSCSFVRSGKSQWEEPFGCRFLGQ